MGVLEHIEALVADLPDIVRQALAVWISGGWAMIPLAVTGFIMYALGLGSLFELIMLGARRAPDKAWQAWLENPAAKTRNPLRRVIADAMQCRSLHEMEAFFQLLASEGVAPFAHRLRVMKVCVATAPLLGLLGTVTGMLTTFNGLAKGGGSDQTMGIISKGISEALVTTETGLVVALTGAFILFFLARQQQRYETAVAHIETLCMAEFQKRLRQGEKEAA